MYPSTVLIGSAIIIALFSPLLILGIIGGNHQTKVPKESRRNKVSSDAALLSTLPSTVSCPRCDANIDITKVSEDRVYACEYCGASGTIEILKTDMA